MSDDKWKTQLTTVEKNTFLDYFKKVDADNKGIVLQDEALQFLRKASIPENILMQFWTAVDNDRKGFLTEEEFCMILKLIACAQHGIMIGEPILSTKSPLPEFNGSSSTSQTPQTPQSQHHQPALNAVTITPESRLKYINLFQSFNPVNNTLNGDTAKDIFMRSGLSPSVLQKIWDLADTRRTGNLNQTEFIIAMHYIEMALKGGSGTQLPPTLPAEIYASATGRNSGAQVAAPQSRMPPSSPLVRNNTMLQSDSTAAATRSPIFKGATALTNLSITTEEYNKYHTFFRQLDTDNTGYVSGSDAVVFFRHSKLPEADLARIWDLADTDSSGRLSEKEFALAMHLINRKIAGVELPQSVSTSNFESIFQSSTNDQLAQSNVDLLGLSNDASNGPLTHADFQETGAHSIADLQRTRTLLQNDIDRETTHLHSAQQSLSQESRQVQELQQSIEKEKEKLDRLKKEVDEAERQLEAERRKKEDLAKELQMYKQEVTHYTSRLEDTKEKLSEEQQLKQPHQQQSNAAGSEHANMFALSSTVGSHNTGNKLFAKVDGETNNDNRQQPRTLTHLTAAISPTLKHQYTGSSTQSQQSPLQANRNLDPFAGIRKGSSSPAVSMNELKEQEARNASPAGSGALTTDLSDIETKFPDLTTMEQNFAAASTSPRPSATQSSPKAASTTFADHGSPGPSANNNNTNSKSPVVKGSSKFDLLSAFDPSASTSFDNVKSSSSVQKELSSIFSPKISAATTSNAQQQSQGETKPSESSNSFNDIFGADSNNSSNNSNTREPTTFEDAFFR